MPIPSSQFPDIKIRVVNVVDLMALEPPTEHPHGISDSDYEDLFPKNVQVIFAFHGYPSVIHKLTYRRTNYPFMHVHGYKEEGTTTTPFDMVVLNELDRFHLSMAVIDRIPKLQPKATYVKQMLKDKLIEHKNHVKTYGIDLPEIRDWKWKK
mgnify:CR=1 FL=1